MKLRGIGRVRAWGALAGLLTTCSACGGPEPVLAKDVEAEPAVSVRLSQVARGPLTRELRLSGVLGTKSEAALSFKVPGVVTRVTVDVGARVRKGQVLATLNATEAESNFLQSREAHLRATRDMERVHTLMSSGALASVDVQNARTAEAVAAAVAEAAAFNLRQTRLVAPEDGLIEQRLLEVGEVVSPGEQVFHLRSSARGLVVRCAVPDREALGIRKGEAASIVLDALPDLPLSGRVSQVATSAIAGTSTFQIELLLEGNLPTDLPLGLTAKVMLTRVDKDVSSVPIASLVDGEGSQAAVYVVREGRAHRVPVRVKYFTGESAALDVPFAASAQVVDLGAAGLSQGTRVRVVSDEQAAVGAQSGGLRQDASAAQTAELHHAR